jgi:DNA polymerase-3 subunit gamma/tau
MADIVHNGLTEMRGTTAPRLLLELITARMLLPGAEDSTGALLQRMERMERRLTAAGEGHSAPVLVAAAAPAPAPMPISAPALTPAPAVTPAPVTVPPLVTAAPVTAPAIEPPPATEPAPVIADDSTPPAASSGAGSSAGAMGQLDVADLRRSWDEVLTLVSRRSKRVAALARDAVVRALDGDTVTLVVKSPALATMLTDGSAAVVDGLHEVFGGTWQVRCEVGAADQGTLDSARPEPRPAPARPQPAPQQSRSAPPAAPEPPSGGAEDWPTTARLGGDAAPEPAATDDPPAKGNAGRTTGGSGRNKAKAATGAPRARGTTRPAAKAASEVANPAYDPFEGFDEGDEPLDDDAESAGPRQSSEEQALQLLAEQLGAEKIGEVEHR